MKFFILQQGFAVKSHLESAFWPWKIRRWVEKYIILLIGSRRDSMYSNGLEFKRQLVFPIRRKRYSPLQRLADTKNKRIVASSDPALQWAATQPPGPIRYLTDDFFFKTVWGCYKQVLSECQSYLRRTRELVGKARKVYESVPNGHKLTKPPRRT